LVVRRELASLGARLIVIDPLSLKVVGQGFACEQVPPLVTIVKTSEVKAAAAVPPLPCP
jgi:hypothetical protein